MALTVGLVKNQETSHSLQTLKDLMYNFKEDVGAFLGWQQVGQQTLNANHVQQRYALQYEHCTLNVDLVANPRARTQVVRSFNLR